MSAGTNIESYLRFPASPISTATSHPTSQDPESYFPARKKPRLDTRQGDILPQQMHQLVQRQDSLQLQGNLNPQLQAALIQQQRLLIQIQLLQQQQQQQPQQQQALRPATQPKRPFDNGLCARRLIKYINHQRHCPPPNNDIMYWRKFVAEYFAPHAKKRCCLSSYENVGNHALGVFPQAAMDGWKCSICCSKSWKGFEDSYEMLPWLNQVNFDSGVTDAILFLNMPLERVLPTGIMVLEYARAVQQTAYEQLCVVREGHLRVTFGPDLKILSWEFCARRHDVLMPRRLVAPQFNQLIQAAQKYQNAVNDCDSSGVSPQNLQTHCNMFVTAGRQLAQNLELQSLNDLGFSKRYVRCLQISEVVNSIKDLIDLSREHNIGPTEIVKNYTQLDAVRNSSSLGGGGSYNLKQDAPQNIAMSDLLSDISEEFPGLL